MVRPGENEAHENALILIRARRVNEGCGISWLRSACCTIMTKEMAAVYFGIFRKRENSGDLSIA